jgi:hypothetical protein
MTDAEFMAWQHRVITNMAGCTCNLPYKHAKAQPLCERCRVIDEYNERVKDDEE